jgi:hypothetical protein
MKCWLTCGTRGEFAAIRTHRFARVFRRRRKVPALSSGTMQPLECAREWPIRQQDSVPELESEGFDRLFDASYATKPDGLGTGTVDLPFNRGDARLRSFLALHSAGFSAFAFRRRRKVSGPGLLGAIRVHPAVTDD